MDSNQKGLYRLKKRLLALDKSEFIRYQGRIIADVVQTRYSSTLSDEHAKMHEHALARKKVYIEVRKMRQLLNY